jgi:hypothetical protein
MTAWVPRTGSKARDGESGCPRYDAPREDAKDRGRRAAGLWDSFDAVSGRSISQLPLRKIFRSRRRRRRRRRRKGY